MARHSRALQNIQNSACRSAVIHGGSHSVLQKVDNMVDRDCPIYTILTAYLPFTCSIERFELS